MIEANVSRVGARALGAYYTPSSAALVMAEWILTRDRVHVLEPSLGDGAFAHAVRKVSSDRGLTDVRITGVEYDKDPLERAIADGLINRSDAIHSDFLAIEPFLVDAILGNPPFVRLRHLPTAEASVAQTAAQAALGRPMDPGGSVWMPFVLHACRFLRLGGQLALVLPFDVTYVRYARPLWRFLGERFAHLRVTRVRERIFGDLLQDVVLLFAKGCGGSTTHVRFEAFETSTKFRVSAADAHADIPLRDITNGHRPFMEALLPTQLRTLLSGKLADLTVKVGDLAKFNIGYVAGDKSFFHPTVAEISRVDLPRSSIYPALTSARQVRGAGVFTGRLTPSDRSNLFVPAPGPLTASEARYIARGEERGIHHRYKCRVRSPWWIVPGVVRPDLVVSVFSEEPCMLINDAGMYASNSLLCGHLKKGASAEGLVAAWYTPLAKLQRELQIHALGGGVFVLVPREIANVRVPAVGAPPSLAKLDTAIRRWDLAAAYAWGRETVLRQALCLNDSELDLIDEGCAILARWRRPAARRSPDPLRVSPQLSLT